MSISIASLNSGSNGNCYYVGNGQEAVLVDAGLSCRETEKRMAKLGLPMHQVKAVFISHEHGDHIIGLEALAKKHRLPVYISPGTLRGSGLQLPQQQVCSFNDGQPVSIGGLQVTAFSKQHDAADPYSFVVEGNGIKIGVLTDIGVVCKQVAHYFGQCHAVFLESNYDEQMLKTGGYPQRLQKRISGGKGHLSNTEALELFESNRSPFLSHLLLSHLSQNNNTPELALEVFSAYNDVLTIEVASRHAESPLYEITDTGLYPDSLQTVIPYGVKQFSLF